jgi:NADPH2:quinone reductase
VIFIETHEKMRILWQTLIVDRTRIAIQQKGNAMKAILISKTGGPEVLDYQTIDRPKPGQGELLVKMQAAGVNFIDIYHRTGLYPKELPFVPGLEGAGTVIETGSGVTELSAGDHVAFATVPGAYAEYVIAPADRTVKIPQDMPAKQAAAIMLQGMTAHYLLKSTFALKEGDIALVHAAAGGVGSLLVQIAKLCGAKVIGTAGSHEKAERVKSLGADQAIVYSEQDFEKQVQELTGGQGVHVVYDSVGKNTFEKSLNCLRPLGTMVLFGQSSGKVEPLDLTIFNQKGSLFFTRPSLFHYIPDREHLNQRARDLFHWLMSGDLALHIDQEFPLSKAATAHEKLASRQTTGKILLTLGD